MKEERDQIIRIRRGLHHDLKLLSVMKRTTLTEEAEAAVAEHVTKQMKRLERAEKKGAA